MDGSRGAYYQKYIDVCLAKRSSLSIKQSQPQRQGELRIHGVQYSCDQRLVRLDLLVLFDSSTVPQEVRPSLRRFQVGTAACLGPWPSDSLRHLWLPSQNPPTGVLYGVLLTLCRFFTFSIAKSWFPIVYTCFTLCNRCARGMQLGQVVTSAAHTFNVRVGGTQSQS
jgi:hypothetical protein